MRCLAAYRRCATNCRKASGEGIMVSAVNTTAMSTVNLVAQSCRSIWLINLVDQSCQSQGQSVHMADSTTVSCCYYSIRKNFLRGPRACRSCFVTASMGPSTQCVVHRNSAWAIQTQIPLITACGRASRTCQPSFHRPSGVSKLPDQCDVSAAWESRGAWYGESVRITQQGKTLTGVAQEQRWSATALLKWKGPPQ